MAKKSTKKKTEEETVETPVEEKTEDKVEEKVDVISEEGEKNKEEEERKAKLKGQEVKEGDMIIVDILGKTLDENKIVFYACNPEDAQLIPNYDPKNAPQYKPELVIAGKSGFLMKDLEKVEERLVGLKFLEETVISLEAKDAYGEREGKHIEKLNARQFKKDMNEEPRPGATYRDKKGRSGTVLKVAQGRMIVDFNHPLAGKGVEFTVKVLDKIDGVEQQINAFVERRFPGMPAQLFSTKVISNEKTVEIEIPQFLELQVQGQNLFYQKYGLSMDLQEHIADVDTVKYVQVFKKTVPEEHEHEHEDSEEEKKEE